MSLESLNDRNSITKSAIRGPLVGVSNPVAGTITHTEPPEVFDDDIVMEEAKMRDGQEMNSLVAADISNNRSHQVTVSVEDEDCEGSSLP